jgi:hypothetical protein
VFDPQWLPVMTTLEDTLFDPKVIVLGVFGSTNKVSERDLQEHVLLPILQELGSVPTKLLLPSEGNSSIYLQEWAETLSISTQVFRSDWARNGKIAQHLRDDQIRNECTHALVFLSSRSTRLERFSESLSKKGKIVFTSSPELELTQLVYSLERASTHARKSSKGTTQTLLKFQKKGEC